MPLVGGQFFKHADADLVKDLDRRGLLFRHLAYEHSYPHCWRCHTPLMYYAQPSWYIRTTAIKDALLRENEADDLVPRDHQVGPLRRLAEQQHRLGAVAQPLLGHAAAGVALRRRPPEPASGRWPSSSELTGSDQSGLDPHRPYVDEVDLRLPAVRRRPRRGCPR